MLPASPRPPSATPAGRCRPIPRAGVPLSLEDMLPVDLFDSGGAVMARKRAKRQIRPSLRFQPPPMEIPSGALRLAAAALAALFLAHVVMFGLRTVMAERRASSDGMNYISVARNLSAGEGFVQSAPGQNQFTFGARILTPLFRRKRGTRTASACP